MLSIVVLLSISNNVSLRTFGPRRWKSIQRSNYVGPASWFFMASSTRPSSTADPLSWPPSLSSSLRPVSCSVWAFYRDGTAWQGNEVRGVRIVGRLVRPNISAAATMTEFDATDAHHPSTRFSILIGRVSTEDSDRVLELLDALRQQEGSPAYEVIVADRRLDRITELIRGNYPEVRLLLCATETPLPELHARALGYARSEYIVVTEDHCVPPKQWLASMLEAFEAAPEGTVAVGGPVENGVGDAALDWATFLCEYSAFVAPVPNGPAPSLPGMNIAYRRSALVGLGREVLTCGFWETTVHPLFARKNLVLYQSNSIQIFHKKKFSLRLFVHQRFLYSRYYAGLRLSRSTPMARLLMSVLTLGLPALLLLRIARNLTAKKRLIPQFARALPYLTVFVLIWACGELVGYVMGPGDALSRIE